MTSLIFAASLGDQITQAVADVAAGLRYPVLLTAMFALLVVAYEVGRLAVEAWRRTGGTKAPFPQIARKAIDQKQSGDAAGAQATLRAYAYGETLQKATIYTLFAPGPIDAQRAVVEYDLYVSKRLDRVRLLVRAGPALGLMGTLIPLAPALAALGKGEPNVLAEELQTAFAITVVGVLIGLLAFTVAVARERYYTKDLADLELLREMRGDAAILTPASAPQPSSAGLAHMTDTDQPPPDTAATAGQTVGATAVGPATAGGAAGQNPALFSPPAPESKKRFGLKKKAKAQPAPFAPPPPPPPPAPPTQADSQPVPPATPAPAPPAPSAPVTPPEASAPQPPAAPSGEAAQAPADEAGSDETGK